MPVFASTETTTSPSGGFKYSSVMLRTFSSKWRSREILNVPSRNQSDPRLTWGVSVLASAV